MTRLPDWERRLAEYIAEARDRRFAWGEQDCILFAAGAALAMTGHDIAAEYRGQYRNRKEAMAILRAKGKGTLLKTLDATLPRRKPSRARRGDFVWFDGAVGVCTGAEAQFVGEEKLADAANVLMREGLIAIPRRLWTKAWAV